MAMKKTNRGENYNHLLKMWVRHFEEPIEGLVRLSTRKGAEQREIAEAMKLDQSQISKKYGHIIKEEK